MKTLIGKNNYLFLQNDSNKELEVHNNNLCLVDDNFHLKYEKYLHQYLLIVFPNKSLVQKEYLPDGFDLKYRPAFQKYQKYLGEHVLDLYPFLINKDTFYKTDTHINFYGAYISYGLVVEKIKRMFNLPLEKKNINIQTTECVLINLQLGLGDLTWETNLGDQFIENTVDTYYHSDDIELIFPKYEIKTNDKIKILDYELNDCTEKLIGSPVNWDVVSNYIIHSKNDTVEVKKKFLIFYDSFLLSSLTLWMLTFYDVYFVKSNFNEEVIKKINPDYIFEFRVERFLN